tara:strand:- start:38100 stop:38309 length:210 start_codon:yes stop_codon:yes gene_type:complete
MEKLENMTEWKPKRLRTLRNNLNNRIKNFEATSGRGKELQKSNVLYSLTEQECRDLLEKVSKIIKDQNS